jgi:hypothetical protein
MRRIPFAAALVVGLALAGPAAGHLSQPGPGDIIPQYCRTWTNPQPIVPANQPLTFTFIFVGKNRGLDEDWIQGTRLELTINGVAYSGLDSYYQRPGDYHWPTGNPLLETLWGIPWVLPLDFQLGPGESFTYSFTVITEHRLLDGASPNEEGPGKSPFFWDADSHTTNCTVTAAS